MIDRMILALRIADELFCKMQTIPDGKAVSMSDAGAIFRASAQHVLSDEDKEALFRTGIEVSTIMCPDAQVFYLAHCIYHIIQGETGAPKH